MQNQTTYLLCAPCPRATEAAASTSALPDRAPVTGERGVRNNPLQSWKIKQN